MLGHAVVDVLAKDNSMQIFPTSRIALPGFVKFNAEHDNVLDLVAAMKPDWIVNCIGVIKPHIDEKSSDSIVRAIKINALFPKQLASSTNNPIIQIATDCVFSGIKGKYIETDLHDATDVYGKTKSLGEDPTGNMKHLRVSIIGPERGRSTSLLEWFRNQPLNSQINGFTDHLWNGITTTHFGYIVRGIIKNNFLNFEKTHIVPANILDKASLLEVFAQVYNRSDINISKIESSKIINRTLETINPELNLKLWELAGFSTIPSIENMVLEQSNFY